MRKNHNKIVASSWYISLIIYDARSHVQQRKFFISRRHFQKKLISIFSSYVWRSAASVVTVMFVRNIPVL